MRLRLRRAGRSLTLNDVFAFTRPAPANASRARASRRRSARGAERADRHRHDLAVEQGRDRRASLEVDPQRIAVVAPAPDPFFAPGDDNPFMAAWRYVLLVGTREPRKNARVVFEACAQALRGPRDVARHRREARRRERARCCSGWACSIGRVADRRRRDAARALSQRARRRRAVDRRGLRSRRRRGDGVRRAGHRRRRDRACPKRPAAPRCCSTRTTSTRWSDAIRASVCRRRARATRLQRAASAHFAFASRERPARSLPRASAQRSSRYAGSRRRRRANLVDDRAQPRDEPRRRERLGVRAQARRIEARASRSRAIAAASDARSARRRTRRSRPRRSSRARRRRATRSSGVPRRPPRAARARSLLHRGRITRARVADQRVDAPRRRDNRRRTSCAFRRRARAARASCRARCRRRAAARRRSAQAAIARSTRLYGSSRETTTK